MSEMTYEESLDYLFSKLPMFQRIGPPAFKKSLNRTVALMEQLGNPHQRFKSIHIAGTNGKGSVAHMLAAILQAAGYKVGLHTSPHYRDFRERIKLNGQMVSKSYVQDFVNQHQGLMEQLQPSFFELSVGMAFCYFAEQQVNVAVVETGLGGRLDSTNVLTPLLSIITNISYDHQQFLGDTLPEIAGEKAGIIKPGVPVVIGETQPETREVFIKKAEATGSEICFADQVFEVERISVDGEGQTFSVSWTNTGSWPTIRLSVSGSYQQQNLVTVLGSLEYIRTHFEVQVEQMLTGLAHIQELTGIQGRWQVLGQEPLVIAESAHNLAGVKVAMEQLAQLSFSNLHMVWGMVSDKDPVPVLELLPRSAQYYFVRPDIPRGLDAQQLREIGKGVGMMGKAYNSVQQGLEVARKKAASNDLIYVGGSIFVVAEVV